MIAVAVWALAFAAISVAAGRWIDFWSQGELQAALFLARFVVIFSAAGIVWRWTGRSSAVVMFVVIGALGQMVGQIGLLMWDDRHRKKAKGTGANG